ncbi:DUF7666 domain-containing protein [Pseudobutyrivibrio sp.]|uniref:DUF7666 domain-containing protein n=1 Tax=Pseudobutyrivibrio sp. TaxID=2014367 RepID=UPI001D93B089|nr:hypothetical protein [Pseudobutyrivibrio sp.]MBE5910911.1 hypothetical protein [Pseudobutyrivibrio sp.]
MICYKGFNKDLACTMGTGTFQYEVGKRYTEDKAQCVAAGFHVVEEPIEVLDWYSGNTARYCVVDIKGDVHEDGTGRLACTDITILKEISLQQLVALECKWMQDHPKREYNQRIKKDKGIARDGYVIARGRHPKASGAAGSIICLVQEDRAGYVTDIGIFLVDGKDIQPDTFYNVLGKEA